MSRHGAPLRAVVAHGHAMSAPAAEREPLEQAGPLPRCPAPAQHPGAGALVVELLLIRHELVPGNVRRMLRVTTRSPRFLRELRGGPPAELAVDQTDPPLMAAEDVGAGVDRVVQHAQDHGLADGDPAQRAGRDITNWQGEAVPGEVAGGGVRAALQPEALEDEADRALDLLVGVEAKAGSSRLPLVAGWRYETELAPAGLAALAPLQTQSHPVELGFAHGALESQQ